MKKTLAAICFAFLPGTSLLAEDSSLIRLLEIASTYGNISKEGPETIGSILSSVRLANSLTSSSQEIFTETNKTGGSGYTPGIRYSHQFDEDFFVGLSLTRGADVFYDRTSVGSEGAYLKDKTKTRQHQMGIRLGAGPLDYLADESSEFSIGYEVNSQEGPFMTTGFRLPYYDPDTSSVSDIALLIGAGRIEFQNRTLSINFGTSATGDTFGMYMTGSFQILSGSLKLTSQTFDTSIPVSSSTVVVDQPEIAQIHFKKLMGLMLSMELGAIAKFSDSFGLRAGGYYQFAFMDYGTPTGFYLSNGTLNEVSSAVAITSAEQRRQTGFWGLNVGVVTKL